DREAHLEAGGGEIALALGKPDRSEGRQNRRCREQIRDLFGDLRRRGRAQQSQTERAAAGQQQAGGYFRFTCGHLTLSSRRSLAAHSGGLSATIRHGIVLQYECTGKTRLAWSSFSQGGSRRELFRPRWRGGLAHRPTLLNIGSGLYTPSEGEAFVDGERVQG